MKFLHKTSYHHEHRLEVEGDIIEETLQGWFIQEKDGYHSFLIREFWELKKDEEKS